MVLSTSQLRQAWSPHCRNKGNVFYESWKALDACLKKWNYKPRKVDTGAYNCRPITGGSSYSLHAYGPGGGFTFFNGVTIATSLAVDINWQSNPYGPRLITDMPRGMIDDILKIRTKSGHQVFGWGGYYSGNKDAMHFEIVCSPAQLASGIDPRTVPGNTTSEEFDLSTEQYNDLKKDLTQINSKLAEIDTEATKRFDPIIDRLDASIKRLTDLIDTIRDSGRNVANAFRRIMGVEIVDDREKQGTRDAATGRKVQEKLNQ